MDRKKGLDTMNNYGYNFQQSMRTQPLPAQGLKGRPVASLDEARAIPIDFDGSVFYFPDLINKCIYTKQINIDGTAQFNMYELKEMPKAVSQPTFDPNAYVTRAEFEEFVGALKKMIQEQSTPTPIVASSVGEANKKEIKPFI